MLWRNGAATRTMVGRGSLKAPIPDGAFKLSEDAVGAAGDVCLRNMAGAPPECSCYDGKAGGS